MTRISIWMIGLAFLLYPALPIYANQATTAPTVQQKNTISGTPLNMEMAEKYFANCLESSRQQGVMSPTSAQAYCACTAVQMKDHLSQEEVVGLNDKIEISRPILNKVLIHVNGPCMHMPVKDLVNKECMTNLKNAPICNCVSNKISNFIKDISGRMLPEILKDDPNIYDPMGPIMESNEYKMREKQIAMSCATNPNEK